MNTHFGEFMTRHGYSLEGRAGVLESLRPIRNEGIVSYLRNRGLLWRGSL